MMRLHFHKGACSLASHIALEEAGAGYELAKVDFASGAQCSPDYLALNPKGRVPALETDRGVLTENPAILAYVAATHPDKALAPLGDPFAFAEMQAFNLFLCATVHPAFAHYFRPSRYADGEDHQAAVKAKAPEAVADHFRLIEDRLADGREWVHGAAYSVSDPYLFVFTRWLFRDGMGDPHRFPNALKHMARMNRRPAVQRALAAEQDAPVEP
jgi:glutathione S-transferase